MESRRISLAVIKRLPRYYRYLGSLLDAKVFRISSRELAERMNITASQIRQDLNNFGCFGQQGYGYDVKILHDEIKKILGLDKSYNMVIVGAGNIGKALINYSNLENLGFKFKAIFDVSQNIIGTNINDVGVHHVKELETFLETNDIDIAVLTLPKEGIEEVFDIVKESKVKAIWNFSNVDLQAEKGILIENAHLTDSIMTLSYRMKEESIIASLKNNRDIY